MGTTRAQRGPAVDAQEKWKDAVCAMDKVRSTSRRWDSRWWTPWSRSSVHDCPPLLSRTSKAAVLQSQCECRQSVVDKTATSSCQSLFSLLLAPLHPTPFDDCDATRLARSCCTEGQSLPVTHTERQPQLFRCYQATKEKNFFVQFLSFLMISATLADCSRNRNISKRIFFLLLTAA